TQREPNGLAVSSRNKRLSKVQKDRASIFYQSLKAAQTALLTERSMNETAEDINKMFGDHPGIELEYFTVVDSQTLKPVADISKHSQISLCIAGYVGEIRLIDNIFLFPSTNTLF
ncbi:MAG: pantoate--beta-alanine ligase, partial [Bacteroidetes bacterium]|nr:pantoate--beta-alanine ligase [Bacteroidota bacterium]